MPYEKNASQTRPLAPRVATTKSPLTPRLAAQHAARPSPAHSTTLSPRADPPQVPAVTSPTVKDGLNTPVKSLLNSNITPRSSSRKSRIEATSVHATPTSTPTQTTQDTSGRAKLCVTTSSQSTQKKLRSIVAEPNGGNTSQLAKAHTSAPTSTPGLASPREANTSSFFHASDMKSIDTLVQPKKATTFFYANGDKEERELLKSNRAPSPALSIMSSRSHKSQFYHADGRPDLDDVPPLPISPVTQKVPDIKASPVVSPFSIRPPSPQKMNLHLTYRKGASQIISPQNRSHAVPIMPPNNTRRSESPKRQANPVTSQINHSPRSHGRAISLGSIDSSPSSRKSSLLVLDTSLRQGLHARDGSPTSAPPTARIHTSSHSITLDELRPTSSTSNLSQPTSVPLSTPQSPSPPSQAQQQYVEAASNARRERKVLDLEISNSSLLAVNRQLEREVRRQKAQLRRFRRLSRAGRLTSFGSSMAPPDDGDMLQEEHDLLDEFNSGISESEGEEDPDSSLSEESLAESQTSNPSVSQRESARLKKDEKRLKLDLTKHRQLLIDSQKMNQSIKRCMLISEEMIAEGRRALEYHVRET
jgi:hypothetical protein